MLNTERKKKMKNKYPNQVQGHTKKSIVGGNRENQRTVEPLNLFV